MGNDDRKVYCIIGHEGNNGKSTFAKYICNLDMEKRKCLKSGKGPDMAYLIRNMDQLEVICMDLTRSDPKYFQSKFLETLKDRVIQSTKYQSSFIVLETSPACVIFTNKHLRWHHLSRDRWAIADLTINTFYEQDNEETLLELTWWGDDAIECAWNESNDKPEEKEDKNN